MARLIGFISFILALTVAVSCNTSGCLDNQSALPLAEFYGSEGSAISLDSVEIRGIGAPNDSILSEAGYTVSQIYLPMRSTKESTSWCFAYKWKSLDYPQLYDTITFNYDSKPYFTSEECGATYRYQVNQVVNTNHLIDSVVMVDSLITNVDMVYIKIYFKTASSDDEEEE
jgi:hypothetical protein